MADTTLTTVADQIRQEWAPVFEQEFREKHLLANLVDKSPGGLSNIRQGDTIRVSQINEMTGELKTVGVDADAFTPEALTLQKVDVKVDKRALASAVFDDLVELQSQVSLANPDFRSAAAHAMNKQINNHLYSLVAPSAVAPDHARNGIANLTATELTTLTQLADQADWPEGNRWLLVDPRYYKDLLDSNTLTSSDFVPDAPVVGGRIVAQRYGWNIAMDNSAAMTTNITPVAGSGAALAFVPSFMYMVMQQGPSVRISDRHSNNEFKIGFSIDSVFGAILGNDGATKHITVSVDP